VTTTRTATVVDTVRAAATDGRPLEVRGRGSLLSRIPPRPDADRVSVEALDRVVEHEPADLVVTVEAGMPVAALDDLLAVAGQECPLDGPTGASVGGRVATGLAGLRQLGCGPVRDWVLGATFVTGDGQVCRAGGRTVKNVTGFDLPRLLCGSWGTLGVLLEVTLKVRPRPRWSGWYTTDAPVERWLPGLYAPVAVVVGPDRSWVQLEGHPDDGSEQAAVAGLHVSEPPTLPTGHRVAVPPAQLPSLREVLPDRGWLAQWGVGVVHLAASPDLDLATLRTRVAVYGGHVLSFDGTSQLGLARAPRQPTFHRRLKDAFDPAGVLAPWRFAT
jgi:glycolate oxidase FAD binding subunit